MSKELEVMKGATFNYKYQPAQIELEDYDKLVERAELVAEHYDKLVFKDADLSEVNLAHKELNSFIIGLEDSRKKVKREYQKPLNEFENKVKKVVNQLDVPLQKIKSERDEILDAQEEARHDALIDYIKRKVKETDVAVEDLEIQDSWKNKGGWTDKLNPRKKLEDEIGYQIGLVEDENKKKIADRKVLETFLDDKEMEHEGWIGQLEYRDSLEIIQEIIEVEQKKKEKEKQLEEKRKREAEEAIIAEESVKEVVKEPVPVEAVEESIEQPKEEKEEVYMTEVIEVTATREKLELMAQFMIDNGIEYRPYQN